MNRFIVGLLLLVIVAMLMANLIHNDPEGKLISINDALKHAKPGDLVFFKSNLAAINLLFGDVYTHVGIVTQRNNRLCVYELVGKNHITQRKSSGLKCIPLDERLSTYPGRVYINFLNKRLDKKRIDQLNRFYTYGKRHHKYCFDDIKGYLFALKSMITCYHTGHKNRNSCMHCTGFIVECLKAIGVFKEEQVINSHCVLPQNIEYFITNTPLNNGYRYGMTYKVVM